MPWETHAQWCRALAAIATQFPEEMTRRTAKGTPVLRVLLAAGRLERFLWYKNNSLLRADLPPGAREALGVGTCGNEALHAEMRGFFRQVYRIQKTALQLKLNLFVFSKQIAQDAALRLPPLRQMRPGRMLALVLGRELLPRGDWATWQAAALAGGRVQRVAGPMARQRRIDVTRVRQWLRLTAARKAPRRTRRTVFQLRRTAHLYGGGSSWGSGAAAAR